MDRRHFEIPKWCILVRYYIWLCFILSYVGLWADTEWCNLLHFVLCGVVGGYRMVSVTVIVSVICKYPVPPEHYIWFFANNFDLQSVHTAVHIPSLSSWWCYPLWCYPYRMLWVFLFLFFLQLPHQATSSESHPFRLNVSLLQLSAPSSAFYFLQPPAIHRFLFCVLYTRFSGIFSISTFQMPQFSPS